jgi:hypothetical protein
MVWCSVKSTATTLTFKSLKMFYSYRVLSADMFHPLWFFIYSTCMEVCFGSIILNKETLLEMYSNFFPPSLRIGVNFSLPFDGSWVSSYRSGVWLQLVQWKKSSTLNSNPYTIAYRPYKKSLSYVAVVPSLVHYCIVSFSTALPFLYINMLRKLVFSEQNFVVIRHDRR